MSIIHEMRSPALPPHESQSSRGGFVLSASIRACLSSGVCLCSSSV